jgi:hypothetical protein
MEISKLLSVETQPLAMVKRKRADRSETPEFDSRKNQKTSSTLVESARTRCPPCLNCTKIGDQVRDWDAFTRAFTRDLDSYSKSVAIATWQSFLDAKDCSTCLSVVRHFKSEPHGTELRSNCVIGIDKAITTLFLVDVSSVFISISFGEFYGIFGAKGLFLKRLGAFISRACVTDNLI